MDATFEIPCPQFPEVSADLKVKLPFGELKAFRDFTQGLPTDCTMTFNLLLQIQPLLASMACMLKILNVIGKLKGFFDAGPNPFEMAKKAGEVAGAIAEVGSCLPPAMFLSLFCTIKDILLIIVNFLLCLISQLESILEFQVGIDLNAAAGNPALKATLQCALENSKRSAEHLAASIGPIQPLLDMVSMIAGIVGLNIALPPLSGTFQPGADMAEGVAKLKQSVEALKQVVETIPC
ncbi:MAG: hypothetical protein JOZ96_19900 [Acidobacteria bacterium]|nr:hypothetical protein [Acidobacteriota bacterium]